MNNNPIGSIDPDGRDLIVLNAPAHVHSPVGALGHAAVLIGNSQKGYRYYSKNGTNEKKGAFGPSDKNPVKGKYFASLKEFLASNDNKDKDGSYTMGEELKTNDATDKKMEAAALAAVNSDFNVLDQSCIDVASDALTAGGFDPGYSHNSFLGIQNHYLTPIPNVRFNNIRVNNNGTYLYFNAPAKEKKAKVTAEPLSKPTFIPNDPPK